jgi:hypothetical protein
MGALAFWQEESSMLAHYLRLIAFAFGLLIGVQVPGFVDQYVKRVSAHQIEVSRNFVGFQETANQYFGGNVEALIAHHAASEDAPFRDEARTIQAMYQRLKDFNAELAALQGPLLKQIFHVALRPNREIFSETRVAYSYTVPLNLPAIATGIILAVVLAALVEALLVGAVRLLRPRRQRFTITQPPH